MGGLYSALNISKNALLAFQTAVHVTSHNVANVDTEGYCRQRVITTPYPPTPSVVGPLGSGVKVDQIKRYFDAFLEMNINLKRSDLGLLEAEETGLDLIQTLFNETNTQGLSSMLSDFFSAWQGLSDRPEGIPERRVVIEKGQVLAENISERYQKLIALEHNISLKLKDVIDEINDLVKQIADLNLQITAAESGLHQANDLRDQRDRLVAELSELVQIRYFETAQGAYSIVLGNGLNLVDIDNYWQLELSGGEVYWVSDSGEKVRITSKDVSQGKLGGWLRILEQISEDWNHEYIISTKSVFKADGQPIRENSTWQDLGISSSFTITFSGKDHWGEEISGTYTWDPSSDPDATVRDFLDAIEDAFDHTVQAYLTEDGKLVIKDVKRGSGKLSFQFDSGPLDFGNFDDESANHRVEELNITGKFQLFAEELIRSINHIHSEGVGLKFYQGELEGLYQVGGDGKLKALPFYSDLVRNGSFFIWLKDQNNQITPVKVDLSLSNTSTIQDVADQINSAIERMGFDPESSVKAFFRDGHLVFSAEQGWSFAFSNDTSNILMVTGINVFFSGWDAGSIGINTKLSVDPEYIAASRIDRKSWQSEVPIFGSYRSKITVDPDQVEFPGPTEVFVRFYDKEGNLILHETENGFKVKEIRGTLDQIPGLRAYIDSDGHYVIELAPNMDNDYAYFEIGLADPLPDQNFLNFLRDSGLNIPLYAASYGGKESTSFFSDPSTVFLNEGDDLSITFTFYDVEGKKTGEKTITISDGISLKELAAQLDALSEFKAGFSEGESGRFYIRLEDPPEGTDHFEFSVSGGNGNGILDLTDGTTDFSLNLVDKEDRQLASGLEYLVKPTQYKANLNGRDPQNLRFSGNINISFYSSNGNKISSIELSDSSISDVNGNGIIDLEDLVSAIDAQDELDAYLDNGDLFIKMSDQAPSGAAYFVIEGNGNGSAWGQIRLIDLHSSSNYDDEPFYLSFNMGAIEHWLYDQNGNPIDVDPENDVIDPWRMELSTNQGAIQIVQNYNATLNAKYGLHASIDSQGRLLVETSGLYDTESFVITDSLWNAFDSIIRSDKFDPTTNTQFYLSDEEVSLTDTFNPQDITITYFKSDGTTDTVTLSFSSTFTLSDFIDQINLIDQDGDGTSDFSAEIDDSGRLKISINDSDLDNDDEIDWTRFSIESSLSPVEEGNVVFYLSRQTYSQKAGFFNMLQGFFPQPGDNRNALKLANLSNKESEDLGQATVSDFYASLVGEIGITGKSVKNSKSFMEDLLNQLQTMRDNISAVSLDEEMANLIKYQQAFAASAKILTIADEMLDILIQAKR